jgi:3D (Asp-Asp-Asp) domain-containing protein
MKREQRVKGYPLADVWLGRGEGGADNPRNSMCHANTTSLMYPPLALLLIASLGLFASGCATTGRPVAAPAKPKTVPVTATAYSSGAKCNGAWAHRNAIGGPLKSGAVNSAATDWSRIPLGTKFRVVETGKVYIVDDYGSAMVGKDKVDLFHTSYRDVYRWGVRQVTLEIIEWGCPDKSLAVLKPRARAPHVRRMVEVLKLQSSSAG